MSGSGFRKPKAKVGGRVINYKSKPGQEGVIESVDSLGGARVRWGDGSVTSESVIFLRNEVGTLLDWGKF